MDVDAFTAFLSTNDTLNDMFTSLKKEVDDGEAEAYRTTIDHTLLLVQTCQEMVANGKDKDEMLRECNIHPKSYARYEKVAASKHLQDLARAGQLTHAIVDGLSKEEDNNKMLKIMLAVYQSKHLQNLAKSGQMTQEVIDNLL